jgi:CheY-like chemotaxis protein
VNFWSKDLGEVETMSAAKIREGTEKILLVDDYAGVAKVVRQMLLHLGYHVISYTSSIEAFEDFKADPGKFDLILTDFDMPKMNGYQSAQKIMVIRPSIPVIINTGNNHNITADWHQGRAEKTDDRI